MRTTLTFLHQLWCAMTPGAGRVAPETPVRIVARVERGVIVHFPAA
jgi:hypothetical protein